MPQERQNVYPYPTATDVANAPGDRADKAARNIVSRRIEGIPKRGYIMGECDHAPVVKGIRDLCEEVYVLLDSLEGEINPQIEVVRKMMEDHRCPEAPATVEEEGPLG